MISFRRYCVARPRYMNVHDTINGNVLGTLSSLPRYSPPTKGLGKYETLNAIYSVKGSRRFLTRATCQNVRVDLNFNAASLQRVTHTLKASLSYSLSVRYPTESVTKLGFTSRGMYSCLYC